MENARRRRDLRSLMASMDGGSRSNNSKLQGTRAPAYDISGHRLNSSMDGGSSSSSSAASRGLSNKPAAPISGSSALKSQLADRIAFSKLNLIDRTAHGKGMSMSMDGGRMNSMAAQGALSRLGSKAVLDRALRNGNSVDAQTRGRVKIEDGTKIHLKPVHGEILADPPGNVKKDHRKHPVQDPSSNHRRSANLVLIKGVDLAVRDVSNGPEALPCIQRIGKPDQGVRDVSNGPETLQIIERIGKPEEEYSAPSRARSGGLKGSHEGRKRLPLAEEIELRSLHVETRIAESVAESVNAKVKAADMPSEMQVHAFRCARMAYDSQSDGFSSKQLAFAIKKEFDKAYGPAWHCIVGTNFGSFVTHSVGGFLYFSIDKVSILLFKTAVEPLD